MNTGTTLTDNTFTMCNIRNTKQLADLKKATETMSSPSQGFSFWRKASGLLTGTAFFLLFALSFVSTAVAQTISVSRISPTAGQEILLSSGQNVGLSVNTAAAGSITQQFKITNSGGATLSLTPSSTGPNGTDFVITGLSTSVPANSSVTFSIVYTPTTFAVESAVLGILNSSTNNSNFTLNLKGAGKNVAGSNYPLPGGTTAVGSGSSATDVNGRTTVYSGIAATRPSYWGPTVSTSGELQYKISLDDGNNYGGSEIFLFSTAESNTNTLVWHAQSPILTTSGPQFQDIKYTLSLQGGLTFTDPTTLGLSEQLGGLVNVTSISGFTINVKVEIAGQPYLTYFNNYPNKTSGSGAAQLSASSGFYYNICTAPTAYAVTGTGGCGTATIGVANSENGVTYELKNGATTAQTYVSTGTGAFNFPAPVTTPGTYTVNAYSTGNTICSVGMLGSFTVNPSPIIYSVTGGGSCGASPIGVSNSQTTVTYQLRNSSNTVVQTVAPTVAGAFNFAAAAPGTYTVTAFTTAIPACTATMSGSATVTNDVVAPAIVCAAPIAVTNNAGVCGATVTYSISATDNCTSQTNSRKVLVLGSDAVPQNITDLRNKIAAAGNFAAVDQYNSYTGTPTLALLKNYSCVFLYHNYQPQDATTLGNNLAAYMDAGGGVVTCPGDGCTNGTDFSVKGNFNTNTYRVFGLGNVISIDSYSLGTVQLPSHPIMQGVTSFSGTGNLGSDASNLISGAYVIASYSTGTPLIGAKEHIGAQNARNVFFNTFPPYTAGGANIMVNAINWAAQGITITQTAGLPSGSVFPIGVTTNTFTATDSIGNVSAPCSFTVTVSDTTKPVITCLPNIAVQTTGDSCVTVVTYAKPTATDACPTATLPASVPGYTLIGNLAGHRYFISNTASGWNAANAAANAVGGHLAVITSSAENDFVYNNMVIADPSADAKNAWLGGTNYPRTDNQNYKWINDEPFAYNAFGPGLPGPVQPDNSGGNQHYIHYYYGFQVWDDAEETQSFKSIIEFDGSVNVVRTAGPASGSAFPIGTTPVTYTATDFAGNSSSCTFNVTVTRAAGKLYVNDGSTSGDASTTAAGNDATGTGTKCAPYATIAKALSLAVNGDSIVVDAGTYDEQLLVNKSVKLIGAGSAKTFMQFSGTVTGKTTLLDISVPNVTVDGFKFTVDLAKLHSGIVAQGINLDNLTINNNIFAATGNAALSYTPRNAVSVNFGAYSTPGATVNNLIFTNNTVTGGTTALQIFRAGISTDAAGGTFSGNTIFSINQDVQVRFPSFGAVTITNNNFNGGGAEIIEPNAGAGTLTVSNNIFTGPTPDTTLSALRLHTNGAGKATVVSGNTFTGYKLALGLQNYNNVTVNNNTFTPAPGNIRYVHIAVNTKVISSNSNSTANVVPGGTFTNNTFNGSGAAGGTALGFYNHKDAPTGLGAYVIGTAGNENKFNAGIGTFVKLDNQTGTTAGKTEPTNYTATGAEPTTAACWSANENIQNNKFDVGSGLTLPAAMTTAQRVALANNLFDKSDASCAGRLIAALTVHNLTHPADYVTIQEAVDAAVAGDVIKADAGSYPEEVTVNKALTINGENAGTAGNGTRTLETIVDGQGIHAGFIINASNVKIDGFTLQGAAGVYGTGYFTAQNTSGNTLTNSIVRDNTIGATPNSNALSTVSNNLFDGNNRAGAAGGSGIYVDGGTNGLVIKNNEFKNHTVNSAVIFGASAAGTHVNLTFSKNFIHNNNTGNTMVYVVGVTGGTFSENNIVENTTGIKFAGGVTNVNVLNNSFTTTGTAFKLNAEALASGANTGNTIHLNDFTNATTAISNEIAASLNTTCNAYGSTTPAAVAAKISNTGGGSVTYIPYLTSNTDNSPNIGFQTSEVCDVCATASISYAGSPFCKAVGSTSVIYTGTTGDYLGGAFSASPAGLNINAATGAINPSASTAGTYTISYSKIFQNGCAPIAATTTITIYPAVNASISGASNTNICAGQGVSVNVNFNGVPNFVSSFRIREITNLSGPTFGPAVVTANDTSTIVGGQAIAISGTLYLPNTTGVTKTYRIDFNSVKDADSCEATPKNGFVDITVNPVPTILATGPVADVCPGSNIVINVSNPNNVGGTFNWIARDALGNVKGSQTNVAYGIGSVNTALSLTADSCGVNNPITFTLTPVGPSTLFCNGVPTTSVVNVRDVVAPTITFAGLTAATVQCTSAIPAPITTIAGFLSAGGTASDNCTATNNLTVSHTDGAITGDPACEYSFVRHYSILDHCGNASTYDQTITVDHTTAPVVPANGASTVECASLATAPTTPTVVDVCGTAITPGAPVITGTYAGCEGTRIYTYTYTDCSGLATNWSYTYTIDHVTAPVVPANGASTVQCAAAATPPVTPTVVDVCGTTVPAVLVTTVNSPNPVTCEGTRIYNYTYTDCSGLVSNWSYTYTIDHTTAPVVPANGASTVECASLATAPTPPTVVDVCGTAITPSAPVVTGTYAGCEGTRIYTYTYTDCSSLSTNWSYTYTIDHVTAPVVPANGGSTVQCAALATAPTPPTVVDVCGTAITPSAAVITGTYTGCEGTRIYTYTYTDCSGLATAWSYTYTIDHTTAPVVPANGGSTVQCASAATTPTPPTVVDVCGTNVPAVLASTVNTPNPVTCEGTRVYNYTYTDCSGLVSNWSYTYTIDHTTAPVVPANGASTVECASAATAPTPPTVVDVCGTPITPSAAVITGTYTGCEGTRIYTYTYTDCSSLSSVWSYTYTIDHVTAPVVPANGASTVQCASAATAPVTPTVVDVCGTAITPGAAVITGTYAGCEGTRIYTYTYTDCSGLSSMWSYTYTIDHVTAPVVPANGASTVQCASAATAPVTPTVVDVCGTAITPSAAVITGTYTGCEGTRIYTYTYTDCSGLATNWSYTYTIDHVTAPVVPANGASTVQCAAAATAPVTPTVTDVCGTAITPSAAVITGTYTGCEGTRIYTYTYTDCSGLSSVWSYTYTIDHTTAPVVPANGASTVQCASSATPPVTPTVTDVCGTAITPGAAVITGTYTGCEGTRIYTYTYTDCSGLSSVWSYTYTIDHTTAPVVPANGASTVQCASAATAPTTPTVVDVCGTAITPSAAVITGTYAGCEGTRIYTYTYTDCSGLSSVWSYTYTIDHTTAPVVPANGASTVQCASAATAPTTPTVVDVCGTAITPSAAVITGTYAGCEGTRIYTYTYTDCSGLSSMWSYTYTIDHVTAPVVPANGASTVQCASAATAPTTPTVVDVCGTAITPSAPVITGTYTGCEGTRIYTYTYTDCSGLSSVWSYTYTIDHVTAPVVPANGASTVQCASSATAPVTPTVTDVCGTAITPSAAVITGTYTGCEGTRIYTYTYTDCSGLSSVWSYTYTIDDNTAPVITSIPANATVSCAGDVPAANTAAVVATDNCSGAVTVTSADVVTPGSCPSRFTIARTYTATDCAGNASTQVQTITVNDQTGPVLTPPTTQTLNVGAGAGCTVPMPDFRPLVTATDGCGGAVTLAQLAPNAPGSLVIGYGGTRTITIQGTDACGNVSTTTFTLNLVDQTAPTAVCRAVTLNLDATGHGSITAAQVNNASHDNCSGVTVSIDRTTFDCSNVGITNNVVLTVTDASGNVSTCTTTVTVNDITAPVIQCFGDTTISKGINCTNEMPDLTFRVTATDACGFNAGSVTQNIPAGTVLGASVTSIPLTLTVTDKNGNFSTCSFIVNFADRSAPIISACAPTQTASASTSCSAVVPDFTTTVTVTDNCTGSAGLTIVQSPVAGTIVTTGTTPVTITVTDAAGNFSTCTTSFVVNDNTAPIITSCGTAQTGTTNASCAATVPSFISAVTATDNCTAVGSLIITQSPAAGTAVTTGVTMVTITVTDAAGNFSTCTNTFTVTDVTAPIITSCGPAKTGNTNASCSATVPSFISGVVATDNCTAAGSLIITQSPAAGTVVTNGVTTVTITVTDAAGNFRTCTNTFTVTDNTAPIITSCGPAQTGNTNASCSATVPSFISGVTATDNCTAVGSLIITQSPAAGTAVTNGVTTVTITVTDAAGNFSTCTNTFTVTDVTAPIITSCGPAQTGNTNASCSATVPSFISGVTATDNCTAVGSLIITQSPAAGTAVTNGVTTVTITVTDAAGNFSTCTNTFTVTDNTAPIIISCGPAKTGNTNASCSATVPSFISGVTATDNCTAVGSLIITQSPAAGTAVTNGVTTVTITVTDAAGNFSICTNTFTVTDNTAPTITTCAPSVTIPTTSGCQGAVPNLTTGVVAADNCTAVGSLVITQSPAAGTLIPLGPTTVTLTVTDAAGNFTTCTAIVTVTDQTAPTITCAPNVSPAINQAGCTASVNTLNPVISDNCTVASLTWALTGATTGNSPATGINNLGTHTFNVGVTTITYTVKDAAGNTTTCSSTVTVTNNLAGAISGTATVQQNTSTTSNITFTATGGTGPYTFTYNVSVNGGAPGPNQTITTTGANTVTTVPQSNAVLGTYAYNLVSVTSTYGCSGTIPASHTSTITIVPFTGTPDFTPVINTDQLSFAPGASRDFVVFISEGLNSPSTGQVQFRVVKPSTFPVTFNAASGVSDVEGGTPNQNSDWTITSSGAFITCTLKPGVVIPPFGTSTIGFTVTRGAGTGANTTGNISVVITNNSGGDSNPNNNSTNTTVIAQ
jgi:hypothetical protein